MLQCSIASPGSGVPQTNAAWRKQNLGYWLFAASGMFTRDKLATVRTGGFSGVTDALLTLLIHIDPQGTRVTDLAARGGLTKQSVTELIDRAGKLGAVVRQADPADKRARIVQFTPYGALIFEHLQQGIAAAERRFVDSAGADFARAFKDRFGAYSALPVIDVGVVGEGSGERAGNRAEAAWRSGNVGRVFALASRRFASAALGQVHRQQYREVSEVMLALFRNLDLEGTRLTELAARAHMTKQSMRELVDRADAQGLVERRGDPADRRAKMIDFTAAGLAMLEEMRIGLAAAETAAAGIVGAEFLAETKRRLSDYVARLG